MNTAFARSVASLALVPTIALGAAVTTAALASEQSAVVAQQAAAPVDLGPIALVSSTCPPGTRQASVRVSVGYKWLGITQVRRVCRPIY